LDFVNTLDDRHIKPKELLETYMDLARFAEDTAIIQPQQARWLYERSYIDPAGSEKALLLGRELREAIHDVFWAVMNKQAPPVAALARLNTYAQAAAEQMRVVPAKNGFEWQFDNFKDLRSVLWPIARSAAELLVSDQLPLVRACSSKVCEWFFLDTSKNHQRRWCDMTRCGNRAKVQRFYQRKKKAD